MADVGAAVGQKMRSAIKAKLTELDCYVDDELPDYIMVMIANKRTRSQMKEDLELFLASKTSVFVDWLIIVLKRLKEVHVTNPDVFKKPGKRKLNEFTITQDDLKKIKREKKEESKALKKARKDAKASKEAQKSLTDDLPITANKLAGLRKIVIMSDTEASSSNTQVADDSFDIPLLSEINVSNEDELELIERKIKSVKTRLGLLVESDEDDCLNIKADPEDLLLNDQLKKSKDTQNSISKSRKITVESPDKINYSPKQRNDNEESSDSEESSLKRHAKITFDKDKDSLDAKYASILNKRNSEHQTKKKSILDRLGKRRNDYSDSDTNEKRSKSNFNEESLPHDFRRELTSEVSSNRHETGGNWQESNKETSGRNDFKIGQESSKKQEDMRNRLKARFRGDRIRDSRESRDESKGEKPKESIMSRLGVMSKISVPPKRAKSCEIEDDEEELARQLKDVASVVKVKPRVLPPKAKQANPNLLLKAVAEAQRSVAQSQTTTKSTNKKDVAPALFTKKYKEKFENKTKQLGGSVKKKPKLTVKEKKKLQDLLTKDLANNSIQSNPNKNNFNDTDSDDDYKTYTPPRKESPVDFDEPNGVNQQFIVTLDGIHATKYGNSQEQTLIKTKRTPSPIIFDRPKPIKAAKLTHIPDKLPIVPIGGLKNKEKCKFWPGCRQGEKCEFSHPTATCKMFPNCKFEEKCLYIHPSCKFEASCTRRDCPYSHKRTNKIASRVPTSASSIINVQKSSKLQICKFFPNCNNLHCTYYHPRLCKFGNYCKNQKECNFMHSFSKSGGSGGNLTWRPGHKV